MLLYRFSINYDWTRRCGDNWSRMQATAWAASAGWQRPRHKDGTCGKRFGWIVLSRITNTESCREKNKLETQPIAQLHSKQTKELRGWGGKCRNWRNATPTFRNGTILVSEYGIELEYTGLWRTTWPHQHLQDTKKCDNSADKHRFVICRTDHASTWEESAGFWPFWTGGHDCKEYYWGRRYRKPIDYKFKNGTMPKTSEREVAH